MKELQRESVALFRFSVIGSLISGELAHGELKKRIHELSQRRYSIPFSNRTLIGEGTIEEWFYLFRHHGFVGLKPTVRNDKGTIRYLRTELKEALLNMKREHPKMSAKTIMKHLIGKKFDEKGQAYADR